jgi:hypothetical protein
MDMETWAWRQGHEELDMEAWAHGHEDMNIEMWNLKKGNGSPVDFPKSVYRLFIMQTEVCGFSIC